MRQSNVSLSQLLATCCSRSLFRPTQKCSLIVSSVEAWGAITALHARHIFLAEFDLDENNAAGALLLERARRAGHAVIYAGLPDGIPHPNRVTL